MNVTRLNGQSRLSKLKARHNNLKSKISPRLFDGNNRKYQNAIRPMIEYRGVRGDAMEGKACGHCLIA